MTFLRIDSRRSTGFRSHRYSRVLVLVLMASMVVLPSSSAGDGTRSELRTVTERDDAFAAVNKLSDQLRADVPFTTESFAKKLATNPKPCGAGSGGRAVAHLAGAVNVSTKQVQAQAPQACFYDTGATNGGEPRIGVNSKGWIFYAGVDAAGAPWRTPTVRSKDDGKTWEEISPTMPNGDPVVYTLDPYLYVDHDTDRVFTMDLVLPCSRLSFSDDGGDSWTTTLAGCTLTDFQKIFTGPAPETGIQPRGYPNIVYYCAVDAGLTGGASVAASCEKSLDGGLTFVRTGAPAFTDEPASGNGWQGLGHCGGGTFPGAVGPDGTVYLPRGWCGKPLLAISQDEGATWERVQVAKIPANRAEVAVDRKGNIYYAFTGAEDYLPYLTVSRDGGKTWSKPMMVAAPGLKETWSVQIAVGAPGRVSLSYMGSANSPADPFGDSEYNGVTWNGYITTTVNALNRRPIFYSGSINDPRDPLIKGFCGPGRCAHAYDFLGIDIGPDGTPWGAFADGCYEGTCDHDGVVLRNVGKGVVGRLVGGVLGKRN